MRKLYHICESWTEEDVRFLSSHGIRTSAAYKGLDVPEDIYLALCNRLKKTLWHYWWYDYSLSEILNAEYCCISQTYFCGYPKPENSYMTVTFDTSEMCPKCHMGATQNNSFRVSKVSKHGFWRFLAWEPDKFFVRDDVYAEVFSEYGIPRMPLLTGSKKVIDGISQLIIPKTNELLKPGYDIETCPVCGRQRYVGSQIPHTPYFKLHKHPLPGIFQTKETFGGGWYAVSETLISAKVVRKLLALGETKASWLIPCK